MSRISRVKITAMVKKGGGEGVIGDTEWGKLRKEGVYFDIINGDFRQVVCLEPYEERVCTEIEILDFSFKEEDNAKPESQS